VQREGSGLGGPAADSEADLPWCCEHSNLLLVPSTCDMCVVACQVRPLRAVRAIVGLADVSPDLVVCRVRQRQRGAFGMSAVAARCPLDCLLSLIANSEIEAGILSLFLQLRRCGS
jgi:hypothetical protein